VIMAQLGVRGWASPQRPHIAVDRGVSGV